MKKITVFLTDDHAIFREGLRLLLEATDDIEVVGEAGNGSRAVGEAKRLNPDVVLMDLAMPLLNGVEAARRITQEVPAVKVLILSTYNDDQHVQQAINAGAAGYLTKQAASKDLLLAIRETSKGNAFFSPSIAKRLMTQWHDRHVQPEPPSHTLTTRQAEILQLIAEGYSTKQMAALLAISVKTVEKHRQSLMDRLDIHEIASLTRYAVATGIVGSNQAPGLQVDRDGSVGKRPWPSCAILRDPGSKSSGKPSIDVPRIEMEMGQTPHGKHRDADRSNPAYF